MYLLRLPLLDFHSYDAVQAGSVRLYIPTALFECVVLRPILAVIALVASAAALAFNNSTWIWANDTVPVPGGGENRPAACAFRRHFTPHPGKNPSFTDILVTADDSFTFYVNGEQVGTGAYYPLAYAFRTHLLRSGLNVFAVTATSNSTGSTPAGLLIAMQITYDDGTIDVIVSNTTWLGFTSVPDGYQNPAFPDSSWPAAVEESPYGASAWGPVTIPENPQTFVYTNATNRIWTNEAANASVDAPVGSRPFRLTWTPPAGQTASYVTAIISCDNEYMFFINGDMVAGGYHYHLSQQFSISLSPAANVVFAVNATNYDGPAGFIAEIQITTTGAPACTECSSSSFVITDASWKWTTIVTEGFEDPGYDDSKWSPAVVAEAYPVTFSPSQ
ncbi:hypothetical protein K438DRAFT_2051150 [Mycena galopus ATCC 62051]|nr:hypothetical protein K438DRAFT_2051150 [Mycena galopus ATCC 62051]